VKGAHGPLGIRLVDVGLAVVVLIAVELSVATGNGPGTAPPRGGGVRSVAGPAGRRAGRAPGRLIGPGPWGQLATRTVTRKVWVWTSAHSSLVWSDLAWFDVVGAADGPGLPPDPHGLRDEVMAATPGRVATKYPPVTPSASIRCPFALGTMAAELDLRAAHLAVGVPRR